MFALKASVPKKARDEAEKPFWISFSDLMSALMVLFLLAMTVALLAVTHEISESERQKGIRAHEIELLLNRLDDVIRDFPGVRRHGHSIDFGDRARFATDSHRIDSEQAHLLRAFTPHILALARDPLGQRWLKRVVVEGFADARGTYLHNLNLSLQRSERVLCVLLAPPSPAASETPETLSEADRLMIRQLFFVGGASFNTLRESPEESRRIELRLEFLEPDESRTPLPLPPLDNDPRCPLDR
ncbi:MAG: flagellar motor protein MotB [Betaproteobacteria bacterium]|nr:flagellar motor protein MotB [Betaproteobacteria bacterium]